MLLNFDDDNATPFATGAARYRYIPVPGSDDASRILITIEVDEDLREAILDTGGQYFFCTPDIAESIRPDPEFSLGNKTIKIKGEDVEGTLCRLEIILLSDEGEGNYLRLPVTAFLPHPNQGFVPEFLPYSYLGLHCCMENARFAIDPSRDRFYFGEHPGEQLDE